MKLTWYLNRLRAMSPREIGVRVSLAVRKQLWKSRQTWTAPQPSVRSKQDRWEFPLDVKLADSEIPALIAEAEAYLQGQYVLLNVPFHEDTIDWHLDPQSGRKAPMDFGLGLNYRDPELVGNVKNIWEKSRHHHLTVLALAYALTHDERYAIEVKTQLQSWVEHNPFPVGVNWASSLEFGIRLIAWVWIERLLRGSPVRDELFGEQGCLWTSIYWHQWAIAQYHSPGSSANNHLIGEMAGLFLATLLWPVFPDSQRWNALARSSLEREAVRQTFPSGLNREQAFSYQIFVLEFLLLAGTDAERHAVPFSATFRDAVRRMLEVIPPLTDCGGHLPNYGDGDDGIALLLRPIASSRVDWLYRLGRAWAEVAVPLPNPGSGLLFATIVGDDWPDSLPAQPLIRQGARVEDAGLYPLVYHRGQADEIFCIADAGPLGFLSIAAHGHADALSFTLSMAGHPLLIDPGTYTYHAEPQWRQYFRSTRAHNTIVVDDVDQSEPAGTFLWTAKAESTTLSYDISELGGRWLAEHDGYTRLAQPITHRRSISLQASELVIADELVGQGTHQLEWCLHFAPSCSVVLDGPTVCRVTCAAGDAYLELDPKLMWRLETASEEGGWFSAGFNLKQPSVTLVGSAEVETPISLQTVIQCQPQFNCSDGEPIQCSQSAE